MVEDPTVTLLCQVLSIVLGKELGVNVRLCFSGSVVFLEVVEASGANPGQGTRLLLVTGVEDAFVLPDQSSKMCAFSHPQLMPSLF